MTAPPRALVGGRYRLVSRLGHGGMAVVWRAHDEQLHRDVALKVIFKVSAGEEAIERFRLEGRSAARVQHPNIVAVHDQGEDDDHYFISMELVNGETLERRLGRARMEWQEIMQITAQLCDGVAAAHRQGVVHRDLKPANILLAQDSHGAPLVKILDFGVATQVGGKRDGVHTQIGAIVGTAAYLAPEMLLSPNPRIYAKDPARDTYAVGVMLYEMICGRRPYGSTSLLGLTSEMRDFSPRPPSAWPSPSRPVPPAVDHLVLWTLRPDPKQRLSSLHLLAGELDATLRKSGCLPALQPLVYASTTPLISTTEAALTTPPEGLLTLDRPRARHAGITTALVACIACVGGVLGVLQRPPVEPDAPVVSLVAEIHEPPTSMIELEPTAAGLPPTPQSPQQEAALPNIQGPSPGAPRSTSGRTAPPAPPRVAQEGARALLRGDLPAAEQLLARCVKEVGLPSCHRQLGVLYQRKGDREKAEQHLRRYLILSPEAPDAAEVRSIVEQTHPVRTSTSAEAME
jgi:serine/threonine protein kinase